MANWAADFLERNPDLARYPVRRHRHALSFETPSGERRSVFVGAPAHYWSLAEGWQEIDTALRRMPDGGYAAAGLPIRIYPDGTSICGGYAQRSSRVGILSGGRFWPLAVLGPGSVSGDSLVREAPGYRHVMRLTETGLREELHLDRDVPGEPEDLLVLETHSRGRLPVGFRFGRPVDGNGLPLTRRGAWAGLPIPRARAGAMLDPDYACGTADGYVYSLNADYATARSTSDYYDSAATTMYLGQQVSGSDFTVFRAFVLFDTSAIPDTDVISQVNLKLVCTNDSSTTDFDIQIVKQSWASQNPLSDANREAAFDNCLSGTADSAIWRNTSGMSTNTVYTSGNLATTWPSKTGTTYYSLRSSRDYAGTEPSGTEFIRLATQNHATTGYRPLLAVTHAASTKAMRRALLGVGW